MYGIPRLACQSAVSIADDAAEAQSRPNDMPSWHNDFPLRHMMPTGGFNELDTVRAASLNYLHHGEVPM